MARIHRKLYKRDLQNPDNHDGVITYLEPDILECEVKWALGSITTNKTSRGDGIPVELFQILKDDAVKVLHSTCQQIWKTQQQPQDWKRSVFIPVPKKGNAKECSYYHTIALISHASKVMVKIVQAKLQNSWTVNFQMFKLDLGGRGTGRLQSLGSRRVGFDWATSLSLFTFMHWRRKWQPTPVFLHGESQGPGCTESDTTEVT